MYDVLFTNEATNTAHSTKNTIKLAPQWTPTITGYMERREKLSTAVGNLAIAANPMIFPINSR